MRIQRALSSAEQGPTREPYQSDAGRLLIVASDTGGSGATGLKDEIRRGLASHELVAAEGLRVGTATATEPITAAQLVELASDADGAYGPG